MLISIIKHIPLITYEHDRTFPSNINTANFNELLKILGRFQYIYTISGHDTSNSWKVEVNHSHGWHGRPFIAHTLAEVRGNGWLGPRDDRGVRSATMSDGNPNGYYLFHFEGNKVKPQFIPAVGDPKNRLKVMLSPQLMDPDSTIQTRPLKLDRGMQADNTFVVVNFFDGGERDKVTISLDGKAPLIMKYTERTDPSYINQYNKYKDTHDSFPPAVVSSHIWQFALPLLNPGLHTAIVKAIDEFGFEYEEKFTFEIINNR